MRDTEPTDAAVDYNSETGTYRGYFDPDSEPVSDAVVRVLSRISEREPEDLRPVDDIVDPIVLDALVRERRGEFQFRFEHEGYAVLVTSGGELLVWSGTVPLGGEILTDAQFRSALDQIVREAEENGIGVEGGWETSAADEGSVWDVEILEVRRSD
ncbi:HalOD1 output domain-containing protein [Halogeometricum luteum]|uniref:Halobacterial output domain-containing protein n=1 Tax=Halogeometricum luteum TaxID=2950537 RepID=A0ABU2FXI2_9EURY|nr:HalOD1 output domain-containing protein [Halogeometricum sp. S3BR5-2]MDS0293225.1 hypothetical protein [Halogeometricum sp. S3BR5-2]